MVCYPQFVRLGTRVGDARYHQPDMKIAYLFLPVYFGLFAGFVGHSVRVGLAGAAVGLFLAVWLAREGVPPRVWRRSTR